MRKLLLSMLALATLAVTPTMAEDVAITAQKLPEAAQQFLHNNFAQNKVVVASYDRDFIAKEYTVLLDNGTKIEFDATGKWEKIKNKQGNLPISITPKPIVEFIQQRYKGGNITKIERSNGFYEVELMGDIELKFDRNFNCVDIDL